MLPFLAAAAVPFLPGGKKAIRSTTDALTGKSRYEASGYTSAEGYDPNAKYVGGSAEASAAEAYDRGREADIALQRQGPQADFGQANYAAKQADYARQSQTDAMGMMRDRANGTAPSIAQMQADRQMGQARNAQASAAASARGPAGLAMAQNAAQGNMAAAQANISGQAQIAAAQERQAAEQAYFGAASGIRGGDVSQQGQYANNAQFQASLQDRQAGRNDARSLAYDQGAWDVGNRNQAAAMQEQGYVAQGHQSAQQTNADTAKANAGGVQQLAKGALSGVSGAIGGAMMSDVNAKQDVASPLALGAMGAGPGHGQKSLEQTHRTLPGGVNIRNDHRYGGGEAAPNLSSPIQMGGVLGQAQPSPDTDRDPGMGIMAAGQGGNYQALGGYAKSREGQPGSLFTPEQTDPMDGTTLAQREVMLSDERSKTPDPMLEQLATMEPSAYRYKPGMGKSTEDAHVGPMAQNMAAAPVTATAVTQRPDGMLGLDGEKSLKLAMGGVGYLAKKQEALEAKLAAKGGK